MRLYTFVNHVYMSPIQHGIQSAHVVAELFNKYMTKQYYGTKQCDTLIEWSTQHKTMYVMGGGGASNLQSIYDKLSVNHPYPIALFHEGMDELNGALTCVGIVLPETVYGYNQSKVMASPPYQFTNVDDYNIACEIMKYKFA